MGSPRDIPSIEQLRQRGALRDLERIHGREAVVQALRAEADVMRSRLREGTAPLDVGASIADAVPLRLALEQAFSLRAVINATGVILHTNLGRAPLARSAAVRIAELATGYTNLEYDVERGERGRRDVHVEHLLCRLTGAGAGVVVNNNAAATLICLAALGAGREVLISRGELVEIGGGFRIPEVLAQSGARLREVGTTNRTRVSDYAAALSDRTAAILRVHPSNFTIQGFTERPGLDDLVTLGRRFGVMVIEDLGSGYLGFAPEVDGLREEPDVRASVAAGADIVMFSGDKLLGGPQSGVIVGTSAAVSRIRSHPLMRALRVDKLTYAALEATLREFAAGRATEHVPVAAMLTMSIERIAARAEALGVQLRASGIEASTIDGYSTAGGGTAPGSALPTRLLLLSSPELPARALAARLRQQNPPVIARIQDDRVVLDLRTVPLEQDPALLTLVQSAMGPVQP